MAEALLTAKELAGQWGVSVYHIYRLTNQKDGLRGYKVGRLIRYKPSEVEAYLCAQQINPIVKEKQSSGIRRFQYVPGMKVVHL